MYLYLYMKKFSRGTVESLENEKKSDEKRILYFFFFFCILFKIYGIYDKSDTNLFYNCILHGESLSFMRMILKDLLCKTLVFRFL
jgi:hypothetical protein